MEELQAVTISMPASVVARAGRALAAVGFLDCPHVSEELVLRVISQCRDAVESLLDATPDGVDLAEH